MPPSTPLLCTSYLPPIAYMAVLAHHDTAIIERCETYPKQTLRNRCVITTSNGSLPLTVPVVRINGNHTLTRDVQISYHGNWHTIHWRAICSAYSAAPYFLYYKDPLERILAEHHDKLLEMNQSLLTTLLRMLKIECRVYASEDFYPITTKDKKPPTAAGNDERHTDGKDVCHKDGMDTHLVDGKDDGLDEPNALCPAMRQHGRIMDLRNEFSIKEPYSGIDFPPYSQVFNDRLGFVPNVSILDLLFNLGPETKRYLQQLPIGV